MVSNAIFKAPINFDPFKSEQASALYIWFKCEMLVFFATIASNIFFLAIRGAVRHKFEINKIPESKQLPDIDTVVAI